MYSNKILSTYSVAPSSTLEVTAPEAGSLPGPSLTAPSIEAGDVGEASGKKTKTSNTHSLLPDSFRKTYANAKALLEKSLGRKPKPLKKTASLSSLDQVVIEGIEQDHELHKDRAANIMGKVKLVTKVGDVVDTGLGKAADLFEAAECMEQFCEVIAAPPAARALKVVTGVVDGVKAVRNRQLANHGTNKLVEQLATARKLEIVGRFTGNQELVMAAERNQMVDNFLYAVLEKAKHGQELETMVAAIETASGACMLAGLVSGNPGALAASTALGMTSTAIKGAEIVVNEGQIRYYKGKRLAADERLAAGAFKKWAAIADVKPVSSDTSVEATDLQVGADVKTKEFTNSIWYKEDMAKLIVARIRQRPRNKIYGRVLEMCGEEPDAFTPEKLSKLSRLGKKKLIESIEDKLSGRDKTVRGTLKKIKTTLVTLRESVDDNFEVKRNQIKNVLARYDLREYAALSNKTADLVELSVDTDVDADEVIFGLFDQAKTEGPDSERALRHLLHFSGLAHKKELKGSNAPGRLKTRLVLLEAIAEHLEGNPEDTIEAACEQVDEDIDVLDLAAKLSLTEESITLKGDNLRALATAKGLNASTTVSQPLQDAIDAGPETVEALHNYLHISGWPHTKSKVGTTAWSRLEARLELLVELNRHQEAHPEASLLTSIEALEGSINKIELARRMPK